MVWNMSLGEHRGSGRLWDAYSATLSSPEAYSTLSDQSDMSKKYPTPPVIAKFTCPRVERTASHVETGCEYAGYSEIQKRQSVMRELKVYELLNSGDMRRARILPNLYGVFGSLQPSLGEDQETWLMILEHCGKPIRREMLPKLR
jgi:hypothetical protein